MNEKIKWPSPYVDKSHSRFGKRSSTLWREFCEDHLAHCDDPECHVRILVKIINEE